ncbi:type III-B CRISPR module RAMP protein Cmr6 [Paenibacillus peoriae]|uniref:type III-B CRISPR module RAMP protein Cmr6 n=1 Tax=Paenibacillus peoriae TaxID=59893 RepID=UPI00096DDD3F|nr:type III-B CRISPR module RAMP protein Cmr6 [Paenibacillus peoriae]OMF34772.1 type III-B CRISPR module RAMP protein Cmr6 [Paenibacillus peoriae]
MLNAYLAITKQATTDSSAHKITLCQAIQNPPDREKDKGALYKQVIQEHKSAWQLKGQQEWYQARFDQYKQALAANLSLSRINEFVMKNVSPLLIGHGGISALETSLTLHRIYGVPYIPGSAIKGLAAHYCHHILGKENSDFLADHAYYTALFGSQDQAGYICFHDAWVSPHMVGNALVQDVMTPHHQAYNAIQLQKLDPKTSAAPRDDDDPNPLPFLAVSSSHFRFMLTCAIDGLDEVQTKQWLDIAEEIVVHALEHEGIGGKTNAGYGCMVRVTGE